MDASRLNLVVIGAEGHGKSTLIHAILGDELSPREKNEPGTVAPVYIEGANVAQSEFLVEVLGPDGPVAVRCRDREEFFSYIRQAANPENKN